MAMIEGPEFTFTPGATKGANIYGDWAALMAKIATQPSQRPTITITSDFILPSGTWDLRGGILKSPLPLNGPITLTVPDGAFIDNCYSIATGLVVDCTHTAVGDTFLFSGTPMGQYKILRIYEGAGLFNNGTQPLITVGVGEVFVLVMTKNGDCLAPVSFVRGADVTSVIYALDGGGLCSFPDNWVDGIGNLGYQLGAYQNQPDIPNWLGTPASRNYTALSQNVLYTPNNFTNWPVSYPQFVNTALNQLAAREETLILAALSNPATYFPGEYVGPFYNDTSDPVIVAYGSGAGFYRIKQAGTLRNFAWTNSEPPGSPIPMDIYLAPLGDPSMFAYTGVSLTMGAGDYITSNSTDTIDVVEDDIIIAYNPSLIVGYTPSNLTLSAQFIPKP